MSDPEPPVSDRNRQLLPRLLQILDTVTEGEIAGIVLNIRRIAGPGFFAGLADPPADIVSLHHADREIAMRMRGLGLILRLVTHPHPQILAAVQRTREAMIDGAAVARLDLLITVACLRDLIEREGHRRAGLAVPLPVLPAGGVNTALRESMDVLFSQVRR